MKYFLPFLLVSFTLALGSCRNGIPENEVWVEGNFIGMNHDTLFLNYRKGGEWIIDTIPAADGRFSFQKTIDEVYEAFLYTNDPDFTIQTPAGEQVVYPGLTFYLTPGGRVSIEGQYETYGTAMVTGGGDNKALMELAEQDRKLQMARWNITKEYYHSTDTVEMAQIRKELSDLLDSINDIHKEYFFNHPVSRPAARFIYQSLFSEYDPVKVDSMYRVLPDSVKDFEYGQLLKDKARSLERTAIGAIAPDFTKMTVDSTHISLSEFRGKYVMLDFWGSWCIPCRMSHPELRELYDNYREEGFEILGISQESGSPTDAWGKWIYAIEEDSIEWPQVLNNADQAREDVVKVYGVSAFPTKIFINREGEIMHKEVGFHENNELDSLLKSLFPEKTQETNQLTD